MEPSSVALRSSTLLAKQGVMVLSAQAPSSLLGKASASAVRVYALHAKRTVGRKWLCCSISLRDHQMAALILAVCSDNDSWHLLNPSLSLGGVLLLLSFYYLFVCLRQTLALDWLRTRR